MVSRRQFLQGSGAAMLGAAVVSKAGAASLPEAPLQSGAATQPPLLPSSGRPYNPVVTLNGWTLPWRMRNGWKEFHLIAEPVEREFVRRVQAKGVSCTVRDTRGREIAAACGQLAAEG